MRSALIVSMVLLSGCLDTLLPPPPGPPRPGSLSGRVVIAIPNRSDRQPLAGVEVSLLGSGVGTVSDTSGEFRLDGITSAAGRVLLRFDAERDGRFERQRLLSLDARRAGPGRQIALGDVVLGENARLEGAALRADVLGRSGHAGSLAFVTEGPFSATTSDDGSFVFSDLPEGALTVSQFRPGYEPREVGEVQLSAGQTLTLRSFSLTPSTTPAGTARVRGRVVTLPATEPAAARVSWTSAEGAETQTSVSSSGEFEQTLSPALYTLRVGLEGYRTAIVSNVLVQGSHRDVGTVVLVAGTGVVGGTGAGGGASAGGQAGGIAGGIGGGSAGGGAAGGGAAGGGAAGGGAASGGAASGGAASGGAASGGAASGGAASGGAASGGIAGGGSSGGAARPIAIVAARSFARVGDPMVRLDGLASIDPTDAGPLAA
jgi:hypothetical protein